LIALAVLNFILAIFYLLAVFAMLALVGVVQKAAADQKLPGVGVVYLVILLLVVILGLLVVSGIGYIMQKKSIGWAVGNAYAIVAILTFVISIAMGTGKFSIFGLVLYVVYPGITLALINTVLKPAFIK